MISMSNIYKREIIYSIHKCLKSNFVPVKFWSHKWLWTLLHTFWPTLLLSLPSWLPPYIPPPWTWTPGRILQNKDFHQSKSTIHIPTFCHLYTMKYFIIHAYSYFYHLNSPSNFIPSIVLNTPQPWNHPCINSPSYRELSGNLMTPIPLGSPLSKLPL